MGYLHMTACSARRTPADPPPTPRLTPADPPANPRRTLGAGTQLGKSASVFVCHHENNVLAVHNAAKKSCLSIPAALGEEEGKRSEEDPRHTPDTA